MAPGASDGGLFRLSAGLAIVSVGSTIKGETVLEIDYLIALFQVLYYEPLAGPSCEIGA